MGLDLQLRCLKNLNTSLFGIEWMDLRDVESKLYDCDSEIKSIESTLITVECELNCSTDSNRTYSLQEIGSRLNRYYDDVKHYRTALRKRREYLLSQPDKPQTDPVQRDPGPDLSPAEERYIRLAFIILGLLLINSIRICKKIWQIGCFAIEHWLAATCFTLLTLSILYLLVFFYYEFADDFKIPQKEKSRLGKLFRFLLVATALFLFCCGFKVQYQQGGNIFSMFYSATLRIFIFLMPGIIIRLWGSMVILFQPKVWKIKGIKKYLLKKLSFPAVIAIAAVISGLCFKGISWCLAEFSVLYDIFRTVPQSIIDIFLW